MSDFTIIDSWDEVPEFESEEQEHEFWSTHCLSERLLDMFQPVTLDLEG